MSEAEDGGGDRTIAERLDYLFRTIRGEDGREFSHREAARAISAYGPPGISHTAIGNLRYGRLSNPTVSTLQGLARFFGVAVEYFTSSSTLEEVQREITLAQAFKQLRGRDKAEDVVVRMRGLSDNGLQALLDVMETIRNLEDRASSKRTDDDSSS